MRFFLTTVTLLLLPVLASLAAAAVPPPATTKAAKVQEVVLDPRSCGSSGKVFPEVEERVATRVRVINAANGGSAARRLSKRAPINFDVYWHTICSGTTLATGALPASAIAAQIAVLNDNFASAGFTFTLVSTDTTVNKPWFTSVAPGTPLQTAMKKALRKGGASALNIYSVGFQSGAAAGYLGYATYPSAYVLQPLDDGIVLRFSSLPGGSTPNYNRGKTATHEVGHWLGLYHTFQGGCTGAGDFVADTPAEATPATGCPTGRDSCRSVAGLDPITNYMSYTWDMCMNSFSAGQAVRMLAQAQLFREVSVATERLAPKKPGRGIRIAE